MIDETIILIAVRHLGASTAMSLDVLHLFRRWANMVACVIVHFFVSSS